MTIIEMPCGKKVPLRGFSRENQDWAHGYQSELCGGVPIFTFGPSSKKAQETMEVQLLKPCRNCSYMIVEGEDI